MIAAINEAFGEVNVIEEFFAMLKFDSLLTVR